MKLVWWKKERKDERKDREDWPSWWDEDEFFGRSFFRNDWFREIDEHFRRMQAQMNAIFEKARRGDLPPPEKGGPYVYGWSFRLGPDGKPSFQEFGNVKGITRLFGEKTGLPGHREPMVDVVESDKSVSVTVELPGVEKKDIDIETTEDTVTVRVDRADKKFYKEIKLPYPVKVDSAKATYQNGVLDLTFERMIPEKKGKKLKID